MSESAEQQKGMGAKQQLVFATSVGAAAIISLIWALVQAGGWAMVAAVAAATLIVEGRLVSQLVKEMRK